MSGEDARADPRLSIRRPLAGPPETRFWISRLKQKTGLLGRGGRETATEMATDQRRPADGATGKKVPSDSSATKARELSATPNGWTSLVEMTDRRTLQPSLSDGKSA